MNNRPLALLVDITRCIGCRYCMLACPFSVPRYEWSRLAPYVKKCDMCAEKIARGEAPACVPVCPAGAVQFGEREALLAEARRRIAENPSYELRIYGEEEVGGTSVLFLSDLPFEQLGFTTPPETRPLAVLTAGPLQEVPTVATLGSAILATLYWITKRREEVALAEETKKDSRPGVAPHTHQRESERS